MTDREREARIRERGTTHWEGCWRSHPRCAEARVEKLEARVERYREALETIARFGAELNCPEAFGRMRAIAHRALNEGGNDA